MKKSILIIAILIAVGLIIAGVWFLAFSKDSNVTATPGNNPSGSLPAVSVVASVPSRVKTQTQSGISVYVQGVASPQNSEVAKDLLSEIQNGNQMGLGGTIVTPSYTLQIWGDANEGGEALLEYASSTAQWKLVSLGGGEWTVLALAQVGVPVSVAEQLVAGLGNTMPASTSPTINIPTGNTLAIGTSEGTVTMSNFYTSAIYIDQAQQAVIIQQSSTYSIIYNISENSFTLTILGASSKASRQIAENAFLNSLNISQQDACKLSVYESSPQDTSMNSQQQGLSFCATAAGAFRSQ